MVVTKGWHKWIAVGVCTFLFFELAACGTVIYPERRGQSRGEIDPVVAVLDGLGLLFFLIPGVAAFIIDFNTGAIYLPGGQKARDKMEKIKKSLGGRIEIRGETVMLQLEPQELTDDAVQQIAGAIAGEAFQGKDLQVRALNAEEDPGEMLALVGSPYRE